jgi:hypothetical protein
MLAALALCSFELGNLPAPGSSRSIIITASVAVGGCQARGSFVATMTPITPSLPEPESLSSSSPRRRGCCCPPHRKTGPVPQSHGQASDPRHPSNRLIVVDAVSALRGNSHALTFSSTRGAPLVPEAHACPPSRHAAEPSGWFATTLAARGQNEHRDQRPNSDHGLSTLSAGLS